MTYKQIRRRTHGELGQTERATPEVSHAPEVSHIQTDRDLMTANDALALQDVVGNRAVTQLTGAATSTLSTRIGYVQPKPLPAPMLRRESSPTKPAYANIMRKLGIQPKLTVGAAHDPFEQEADHVASKVMSQPAEVQRAEDEEMQLKPQIQRASWDGSFDTNANFESQVNQQSGGGKPLPSDVRADLEPKFGADFSGVKIHADANAAQLSQDVGAQAFTHGSDIYFNQGKYNPESSSGKHLLAHELTHTVQQGAAGVQRHTMPLEKKEDELQTKPAVQRHTMPLEKKEDELQTKPLTNSSKSHHIQRNVKWGANLPNVKDMGKTRMEKVLGYDNITTQSQQQAIVDAPNKIADDDFMEDVINEVKQQNPTILNQKETDVYMADIREIFAGVYDPNEPFLGNIFNRIAGQFMVKGKQDGLTKRILDRVQDKIIISVRDDLIDTTPDARPEWQYMKGNKDTNTATTKFFEEREGKNLDMQSAYLTKAKKKLFAVALKKLPTVQNLLKPVAERKVQDAKAEWKDGGSLVDKIQPKDDLVKAKKWLAQKRLNSKTFRAKVAQTDAFVKMLIDPVFLKQIPRPTINVHSTAAMGYTTPWGFRPFGGSDKIDVSYNESRHVISHEIGHVLEEYMPMKYWHDIHIMLAKRHQAAGGGNKALSGANLFTLRSEGRYGGDYVTGQYTSTAYTFDNAEVVSMAMQFFSKPSDALKLIDKDPQHAALVLRSMNPSEYNAEIALKDFDKYLPGEKRD